MASYAEIVKSEPKFYFLVKQVVINSDSAYIKFDLINKYKLKSSGKFTLFNDGEKNEDGSITSAAHNEFIIIRQD